MAKTYRLSVRTNKAQKFLIQKAADLEGRSLTDFVLLSAEAAARRTIEQRTVLTLGARDTEIFVNAILHPAEPGPALRTAAREYKQVFGES
jgi:uncharacterized protein (DUF1778 family)